MPLMNCRCGTSGVNDVAADCPVHGKFPHLRWEPNEIDDDEGDIVCEEHGYSNFRVIAQCVDKDMGEMIVNDVSAHDALLAACEDFVRNCPCCGGRGAIDDRILANGDISPAGLCVWCDKFRAAIVLARGQEVKA